MAAKFVHLHVHSHYSLLKALPKIPELVARAKEEGCEALALTDIDNLYGAIEFYKECKSQGIKPIIGLDASVESGRQILLAENFEGYQNLLKLVTLSHKEDAQGRPLTREELKTHSAGLITIDPVSSEVPLAEIFYLKPDDRRAWETMRAIEHRGPADNQLEGDDEYYFLST